MQTPQMTIFLVVGLQRERGVRALQSILAQSNIDQLEVLLYDSASDTEAPLPGSDHPSVRLMPLPPVKSYGEAIVCGLNDARAPIIAVIEEHCAVFPGWAEALIQAHQSSYAVVSGEIYNGNPGHGASDKIYVSDYWPMMPPRPRGETTRMIGHNSSFKRDILLQYPREQLIELFQNDVLLTWRLRQDGYKLFAEPDAKFSHANEPYSRSHCVGFYLSSRAYALPRVHTYHWSVYRRAFYALIVPVSPFIRLTRQLVNVSKERPQYLPILLRNAPRLWLYHAAAALGHAVGLIWGTGDAGQRFLTFELNEYRSIDGINVRKIFMPIRSRLDLPGSEKWF